MQQFVNRLLEPKNKRRFWQSRANSRNCQDLKRKVITLEVEKEGACIICKEVITNPICLECINHEIKGWLGENNPKLITLVDDKTRNICDEYEYINSYNQMNCVICRNSMSICYECYLKEISNALKPKGVKIFDRFNRMFNFNLIMLH